jgi:ribonuclease P protein component
LANQKFTKDERLTAKKTIDRLFKEPTGSFFAYPVKLTFLTSPAQEATSSIQVLISVPKRHFKKAHDRNRIKRQLREIYRKNKSILYDCLTSEQQQACFLLGYVAKQHIQTIALEQKVVDLFKQFANAMAKSNT